MIIGITDAVAGRDSHGLSCPAFPKNPLALRVKSLVSVRMTLPMNPATTLLISLVMLTLPGSAQDQTSPVPELETLQKEYAALVTTADTPHLAALAKLDKKYIAKLEQEQKAAQQAGKLDEAMAMNAEQKAISSGSGVPVEDDPKTPGALRQMHATYRAEIVKIELARAKNHKLLINDFAVKLDALVKSLTKAGKFPEAMAVRTFRENLPPVPAATTLNPPAGSNHLVLYYSFDSEGNKVPDKSGKGNDGEVRGAKWTSMGKVGGAMSFDGERATVVVGNPDKLKLQDFTIMAWIKREQVSDHNEIVLGYGSQGYALALAPNGSAFLTKCDVSHVTSETLIDANNFHHVAVTKRGQRIVFYLDGAARPAANYNPGFGFGCDVAVGNRADNLGAGFHGVVDEVRVYDTALTTAEISRLYTATQPNAVPMKRSDWTCWEKSIGGNGHWYRAIACTNGVTWTEADRLAAAAGGYLATITSKKENAFVFKLVNSPKFFSALNGAGPALGGFQEDGAKEPDGGWCWINSDEWNYTNWWSGTPNNSGGIEDRLQFFSGIPRTPAAEWNDFSRSDNNAGGYVIERDD